MDIRPIKRFFSVYPGAFFTVILVFICTQVIASQAGEYNSNYPLEPETGKHTAKDDTLDHVNFKDTIRQGYNSSICELKEARSAFAYARCPERCEPFSLNIFATCASMLQFGCGLQVCDFGKFKCSMKDLSSDVTVCPGGKVLFDSVELKKLQKVRISIDFEANPLITTGYSVFDVNEIACAPYVSSVHHPALPVAVRPGGKTTVTNTMMIKPGVCETVGQPIECVYRYESRVGLVKSYVEFVRVKVCS